MFENMIDSSSDAVEDWDWSVAKRRFSDLRGEFVGLATRPEANRRELF